MAQIDVIYHLTGCNEKNNIISLIVLPKMHDLNLNMRKYQENKIWSPVEKQPACSTQKDQGHGSQGETEELFHTEREEERWKWNKTCDPGLACFAIKNILKNLNEDSGLTLYYYINVNFLLLIIVLRLSKKMAKTVNSKCWWGCGAGGCIIQCWWECTLAQSLWKIWHYLLKL